jgi:hypothetical protein
MTGPRVSSSRAIAVLVVAGALMLVASTALTGCSSSTRTPKPASSRSSSAATTKPTPTPTPTPAFSVQSYTCSSILPPATLTVFKSKSSAGFALAPDYLQRMQNIGSHLVSFNTYGGILCQWSYPDAENSVDYAFSPITSQEAATQQQSLTSTGYVGTAKYHGTLYANTDTADYPDEYLFIQGYWFQASTDAVMQLIIDNVFTTTG